MCFQLTACAHRGDCRTHAAATYSPAEKVESLLLHGCYAPTVGCGLEKQRAFKLLERLQYALFGSFQQGLLLVKEQLHNQKVQKGIQTKTTCKEPKTQPQLKCGTQAHSHQKHTTACPHKLTISLDLSRPLSTSLTVRLSGVTLTSTSCEGILRCRTAKGYWCLLYCLYASLIERESFANSQGRWLMKKNCRSGADRPIVCIGLDTNPCTSSPLSGGSSIEATAVKVATCSQTTQMKKERTRGAWSCRRMHPRAHMHSHRSTHLHASARINKRPRIFHHVVICIHQQFCCQRAP